MEFIEYVILLSMFFVGTGSMIMVAKLGKIRKKSPKKQAIQAVDQVTIETINQMAGVNDILRKEAKSNQGKIYRLQQKVDELSGLQTDEDEEEEEVMTLDKLKPEEAFAIVKQFRPGVTQQQVQTLMANPMVKQYLKDKTLDDLKEIVDYVKPFMANQSQDGNTSLPEITDKFGA